MVSEFLIKVPYDRTRQIWQTFFANVLRTRLKKGNECPTQQSLAYDSAYFHALAVFNLDTRKTNQFREKPANHIFPLDRFYKKLFHLGRLHLCPSLWPRGHRRICLPQLGHWSNGFESYSGYGRMFLLSCVRRWTIPSCKEPYHMSINFRNAAERTGCTGLWHYST